MNTKWPVSNADFLRINGGLSIEIMNQQDIEVEFYIYASKFKKAAHILVEHLLKSADISKLDTYFFSLAYLYRHSCELLLKAIGFKHIVEDENRKLFIKDTFHNLSDILREITPHIQILIDKDMHAYEWIAIYFEDMSAIDKESDSFRYPFAISINKNYIFGGVKYSIRKVFDKQTHIDLVLFANKMETALDILDLLYQDSYGISIYCLDYKPTYLDTGGTYYGQSVVGYSFHGEEYYPFVRAYTESAKYLYDNICSDNNLKDDLFIPMCYLFRNAIELSLKQILFEESSYNSQDALKLIFSKKHSFLGLWNLIKEEVIENAEASEDDITINNVNYYIVQLHNVDGSSDKFRYPVNKYLEPHFKNKKKFDVDNVYNFFVELANFLSAVDTMMSVHNDLRAEMEAEYRAEMSSFYY